MKQVALGILYISQKKNQKRQVDALTVPRSQLYSSCSRISKLWQIHTHTWYKTTTCILYEFRKTLRKTGTGVKRRKIKKKKKSKNKKTKKNIWMRHRNCLCSPEWRRFPFVRRISAHYWNVDENLIFQSTKIKKSVFGEKIRFFQMQIQKIKIKIKQMVFL